MRVIYQSYNYISSSATVARTAPNGAVVGCHISIN